MTHVVVWACLLVCGAVSTARAQEPSPRAAAAPATTRSQAPVPARAQDTVAATSASGDVARLDRRVTLSLRDVPVSTAVQAIDQQAKLRLNYSEQVLPAKKRVTIVVESMPARQALERVLEGTGVVVRSTAEGDLLLVKKDGERRSEVRGDMLGVGGVWGQVVDSVTARPLVGVVIGVKGTSLMTVTDTNGFYQLLKQVSPGVHVITARHLGYMQAVKEVAVADSQSVRVDFVLKMGMSRLQEVVTTATGQQRRMELGNDITVLNADSIARTQPVTSVTDLLEGRVPGLVVQRTSGAPGDPARLRLRGTSSAYLNNDPIVIVDGVRVYAAQSDKRNANLANANFAAPSPLDNIDPHSIETIEVLKGPSAATLYGADAANGVIVVTTKSGSAGPPRWTASLERGVTYMPGSYPDSYLRFAHLPWDDTSIGCGIAYRSCIADSVVRFQALNDPTLTILGHGARTATTVGVSGGTNTMTYAVNANYDHQLGFVRLPGLEVERYQVTHGTTAPEWMQRPQQLTQWGVSSRLTAKLGAKADLSLTAALTRTTQQRSDLESSLLSLMGTYIDRGTGTYFPAGASQGSDALLNSYYTRVTSAGTQFRNGANVQWRPRSWLNASADAGLDVNQREDASLKPRGAVLGDTSGSVAAGRGYSVVSTVNLRATATAPLPLGFHFQMGIGANYTGQRTADLRVQARYLAAGTGSVGQAGKIESVGEQRAEQATFGWYVEPTIAHKRVWLSTGLRLDGSNTYGTRVNLAGLRLPKLSLSYLISDEPFFPFKNVFNTLRLRAAYGHAGVQPAPGDRLRLYTQPISTWVDGHFVDGVTIQTLGNREIRPERSTELEGGFDADLLHDRLSLGASGYRKTRVDALMFFPLPPSVYGGGQILKNIGVIRNAGYELSLGTQLVRSDPVSVSTQLQLSHNRNVVVKLGRGVEPFSPGNETSGGSGGNDSRVVPGYPLNGRWGKPVLGYTDRDGDGIIEPDEVLYGDSLVYLGSSEPDYTVGLSTTLSLFRGAVAVSAGFTYQGGVAQVGPWAQLRSVSRAANDPTAPLGDQAAVLSQDVSDFLNTQTVSTLRFNSLSVAYNVPSRIAERVGARSLAVALQGTNLGLRTNYRGKDPNVNGFSTGNRVGDFGTLPQPRTWQVRVSASY